MLPPAAVQTYGHVDEVLAADNLEKIYIRGDGECQPRSLAYMLIGSKCAPPCIGHVLPAFFWLGRLHAPQAQCVRKPAPGMELTPKPLPFFSCCREDHAAAAVRQTVNRQLLARPEWYMLDVFHNRDDWGGPLLASFSKHPGRFQRAHQLYQAAQWAQAQAPGSEQAQRAYYAAFCAVQAIPRVWGDATTLQAAVDAHGAVVTLVVVDDRSLLLWPYRDSPKVQPRPAALQPGTRVRHFTLVHDEGLHYSATKLVQAALPTRWARGGLQLGRRHSRSAWTALRADPPAPLPLPQAARRGAGRHAIRQGRQLPGTQQG